MQGLRAELRVTLRRFVILGLKELVADVNAAQQSNASDRPWTVSMLLERWLMDALTVKELEAFARRSPEFKNRLPKTGYAGPRAMSKK